MSTNGNSDNETTQPAWNRLASPHYATLVTLVGLLAGGLGSVYSNQIRNAWPLYWGSEGWSGISPYAVAFWLAVAAFGVLFFGRQWAADKARHVSQTQLVDNAKTLEELVRTLPPKGFLTQVAGAFEISRSALLDVVVREEATRTDFEHAVRIVLGNIVNLARYFDGSPNGVDYAANIMLYEPFDGLESEALAQKRDGLMFFPADMDIGTLRGRLCLLQAFSVSTLAKRVSDPDPRLVEFSLPVPEALYSDIESRRCRVLPGAPYAAFVDGRMSAFSDTSDLVKWCEDTGDFTPSLRSEIRQYFDSERGREVRSFFSLAIWFNPESLESGDPPPLGVLNIHRTREGLLDDELQAELFLPLITPFLYLLADFLSLNNDVQFPEAPETQTPHEENQKTDPDQSKA